MAPRKRSKGKSPKRKPQAKTTRSRVVRAAPVVDDELEVFISKSGPPVRLSHDTDSGVRAQRSTKYDAPPTDDDDVAVFVAQPGAPVQVQADWVDDDLAELGFVRDVRAVNGARCKYDCGGAMSKIPNLAAHRYDCPYWRREGHAKTPF